MIQQYQFYFVISIMAKQYYKSYLKASISVLMVYLSRCLIELIFKLYRKQNMVQYEFLPFISDVDLNVIQQVDMR